MDALVPLLQYDHNGSIVSVGCEATRSYRRSNTILQSQTHACMLIVGRLVAAHELVCTFLRSIHIIHAPQPNNAAIQTHIHVPTSSPHLYQLPVLFILTFSALSPVPTRLRAPISSCTLFNTSCPPNLPNRLANTVFSLWSDST